MPDICMCQDNTCPLKDTCYRFLATPTPGWQAYFAEKVRNGEKCEYFWPVNSRMNTTLDKEEREI